MKFEQKYPVPLNALLLAPIVFREDLPQLAKVPGVCARGMTDLASFGGHSDGAIRTALSRLRSSKTVETSVDRDGVTRYQLAPLARSIGATVRGRPSRPEGLLLAVFSFASDDVRERKTVRDALLLHGFHKLAQNVYVNGELDTSALDELFRAEGLGDNVWWFRSTDTRDERLHRKLAKLFDLEARARALAAVRDDLLRYLDAPKLDPLTRARRFLYAGPVHDQVSFVDEPPLPASLLPQGYLLDEVIALMPRFARTHAAALESWFEAFAH
jgi:DNA-binding transcriptional regulator PaaX